MQNQCPYRSRSCSCALAQMNASWSDSCYVHLNHSHGSQEEIDFSRYQLAASAWEVLSILRCVGYGAPYCHWHVSALALAALAQFPLGTALHVSPTQGQEGHKVGYSLCGNYFRLVESTYGAKLIQKLNKMIHTNFSSFSRICFSGCIKKRKLKKKN